MTHPFFLRERELSLPYTAVFLSFVAAATGIVVDQVLKIAVVEQLESLGRVGLTPGFLQFTYVENRGAVSGTLANYQ